MCNSQQVANVKMATTWSKFKVRLINWLQSGNNSYSSCDKHRLKGVKEQNWVILGKYLLWNILCITDAWQEIAQGVLWLRLVTSSFLLEHRKLPPHASRQATANWLLRDISNFVRYVHHNLNFCLPLSKKWVIEATVVFFSSFSQSSYTPVFDFTALLIKLFHVVLFFWAGGGDVAN